MILHHFAQQRLALLRAMKKFLEEKMTCGRSFFAQKYKPSVFFMQNPCIFQKKAVPLQAITKSKGSLDKF